MVKAFCRVYETSFKNLWFCITLTLIFSLLLMECTLIQLRQENKIYEKSAIMVGTVSSTLSLRNAPVIVAAYDKNKHHRNVVHYAALHKPGPYELMVPKGDYNIAAFCDKNKNLIYDKGEPAGQYASGEAVNAPAGGLVQTLDIVISGSETDHIDFPAGSKIPPKKTKPFHSTLPGAVADLDQELFSSEFGEKGYWAPLEFFKEVGGNIYFLEAYDPDKIPILFVHGAGGSPQDWKAFFENVDHNKYQPWFFYYPSGAPLDAMSSLLFWKLFNLQKEYKFHKLYITSHSMGGLVVRSFLVNHGPLFPMITKFITISTPWGGEALAGSGVKYSPAVIPSWKDMVPGSPFIRSIFHNKLPSTVDHYLLFGVKGNRNLFRPNNDKAVTLASQLDQRSQSEAKMIYGFDEDHVSILSSKQVLAQYNTILATKDSIGRNAIQANANMLRVDFSFDFPERMPKPVPILVLRPIDRKEQNTILLLSHEDASRELGPFLPGTYDVTLRAQAFAAEPLRTRITIGKRETPVVSFSMKPQGIASGYIVDTKNGDYQAGVMRKPDEEVKIQSITLSGNGIKRTLIPLKIDDVNTMGHYLSGNDYVFKSFFCFYGLSAGRYELTVNARGYEKYTTTTKVTPGRYDNEMAIELVKKN